jgi:neutral ceramidase
MSLLAGAATCDLTPVTPAPLFGYPNVRRVSTGVHDPILVSALYLADSANPDKGVVLMSLDLLLLETPLARRLRTEVAKSAGVPESHVFIGCTHTHSAPVCARFLAWRGDVGAPDPDPAFLEEIVRQAVSAGVGALKAVRPARVAWGSADATGVGGNRISADGPTDPECGILCVRPATGGAPFASVLVYGMHPTVLHEDSTLISSDFPHYTRLHIQERFGAEHVTVYLMAPSGDQSPRRFVSGQTFAEAERLGRILGAAVVSAMEAMPETSFAASVQLAGMLRSVPLPRRTMPALHVAVAMLEQAKTRFERLKAEQAPRAEIRTAECAVFGAQSTLNLARDQETGELDAVVAEAGVSEIQALRVHNATLIGFPGEMFVEYALELKRRAADKVFPASLVNGELKGYICTAAAEAAGGYEAANSLYSHEAGPVLIQSALDVLGKGVGSR